MRRSEEKQPLKDGERRKKDIMENMSYVNRRGNYLGRERARKQAGRMEKGSKGIYKNKVHSARYGKTTMRHYFLFAQKH